MRIEHVPPLPATLFEAMRAIGYSVGTALADLIDNSISAGARNVDINFRDARFGPPYVAIHDDGCGMSEADLIHAMRLGSKHPSDTRAGTDLGRFGLGLKTASQSQCRRLTVITKTKSAQQVIGAQWDIDFLRDNSDWSLRVLEESDLRAEDAGIPVDELNLLAGRASGTIVLWQALDRLTAGLRDDRESLTERLRETASHLGLVFHRFLDGTGDSRLGLKLNQHPVAPIDPFLSDAKSLWEIGRDTIDVYAGHTHPAHVSVEAYVLPSLTKLSPQQLSAVAGKDGLRRGQGFYVYRANRLVVWATWFRMVRQEELTKLARVKVDVPNSLDHLWSLDIRKSSAMPPEAVRERLRAVVERVKDKARRVVTFPGHTARDADSVWCLRTIDAKAFDCYVNRDHPSVRALLNTVGDDQRGAVENLLRGLELALPYSQIYTLMGGDRHASTVDDGDPEINAKVLALANDTIDFLASRGKSRVDAAAYVASIPPFCLNSTIAEKIRDSFGTPPS